MDSSNFTANLEFNFEKQDHFTTFAKKLSQMGEIIIKTPAQIGGIRKSSQLAAQTLDYITPIVKAGVTTEYLDHKIEEFIRDHGAIPATKGYNGYPASSCISLNEIVCHGIPSSKVILKEGDILNIDVTTILDGYYGDTSRMYAVGEVSPEAVKLIETTRHCLDLGIKQVRPGNPLGNIGFVIAGMRALRDSAWSTNFVATVWELIFTRNPRSTIPHAATASPDESRYDLHH